MISDKIPQAGSDEVGTGDTFGPIIVVCSIIEDKDIELLNKFNIKDSKELSDNQILNIAPKLIENIKCSYVIMSNTKYNEITDRYNTNEIKAILHNQVYMELENKYTLPKLCVIDEFCSKDNYFNYLSRNNIHIYKKDLVFEQKAENKYIAVAVSSIIARYYFIKEFDKLSQKYNINLAKGSSNPILASQIKDIATKYGIDELKNVAKLHFKNVQNVINTIK